jgi:hypothetical protein
MNKSKKKRVCARFLNYLSNGKIYFSIPLLDHKTQIIASSVGGKSW